MERRRPRELISTTILERNKMPDATNEYMREVKVATLIPVIALFFLWLIGLKYGWIIVFFLFFIHIFVTHHDFNKPRAYTRFL